MGPAAFRPGPGPVSQGQGEHTVLSREVTYSHLDVGKITLILILNTQLVKNILLREI